MTKLAPYSHELKIARSIVQEAGHSLVKMRQKANLEIHVKGLFDLVTEADLASDDVIRGRLAEAFPDDALLSEEGDGFDPFVGRCWIADPLDGTANYVHQQSHVAVSLALFSEGEAIVGVVHAPFCDETFWAVRGQGAFYNGTPFRIKSPVNPERALIGTGFPHDRQRVAELIDRLGTVLSVFGDIRRLAAPALDVCWVADGRLDGFVDRLMIWDIAAAGLIAEEAGATVRRLSNATRYPEPSDGFDYVVAAEPLLTQLAEIYAK